MTMKRWIPGVIVLAGILATVGFVTSNTETSLASDHLNGIGEIEEIQSDGQVTEGVAFIGITLAPVPEKDIILVVDGIAVESPRDVVEMVHALLPDDVVTFAVSKDGTSLDVEVTATQERKAVAQ